MKDRLITPSYCFILAANFLLYFGFWLMMPVLPFYLTEVFGADKFTMGLVLSCYVLHYCGPLHPPLLGLPARHVCPQAPLPAGLLHLHVYLRWLSAGRHPDPLHRPAHRPRRVVRHGDGRWQYGGHRHHALIAPRRRTGLLRAGQQHCHVHRPHDGPLPA